MNITKVKDVPGYLSHARATIWRNKVTKDISNCTNQLKQAMDTCYRCNDPLNWTQQLNIHTANMRLIMRNAFKVNQAIDKAVERHLIRAQGQRAKTVHTFKPKKLLTNNGG